MCYVPVIKYRWEGHCPRVKMVELTTPLFNCLIQESLLYSQKNNENVIVRDSTLPHSHESEDLLNHNMWVKAFVYNSV